MKINVTRSYWKIIDTAINKYLSPFISAYQQKYNNAVICFSEEWREGVDNKFVVGGVFMDLSKDFDCIPP